MTDSKLREALEPFARLADSVDAAALSYLGVGLAGLVGETALPVGGNAIRDKCSISVEALIAAREALATPPVVEGGWVAVPSIDAKAVAEAVLQSACETDPADPEHPDTVILTCGDLESLVRFHVEVACERALAAAPSAPVVGEGIPLVFYDASDPARRAATLADGLERMQGKIVISGWRMLIADLNRALATPPQSPSEPVDVGLQPVETAPKDGSYFLFVGSNFDGGAAVVRWDDGMDLWCLDDGKNFEIAMRNEAKLLGWLPLPALVALALNPTGAK